MISSPTSSMTLRKSAGRDSHFLRDIANDATKLPKFSPEVAEPVCGARSYGMIDETGKRKPSIVPREAASRTSGVGKIGRASCRERMRSVKVDVRLRRL